ncbi:hypothetical protein DV515_00013875, partial [Chloebia gouldiae]
AALQRGSSGLPLVSLQAGRFTTAVLRGTFFEQVGLHTLGTGCRLDKRTFRKEVEQIQSGTEKLLPIGKLASTSTRLCWRQMKLVVSGVGA